jgi:hypothetical protein
LRVVLLLYLALIHHDRISTNYDLPEIHDPNFSNDWSPIQELKVPKADLSLIFLAAHDIFFLAPAYDPWFSATQGPFNLTVDWGKMPTYRSDRPASAVACTHRHQFCNAAANPTCTPLLGLYEAANTDPSIFFSKQSDMERFTWSALAILRIGNSFKEIARVLQGGALLATDSLCPIGQYALPDNQWELEMEHWFKFTLANLQRTIVDQATGPMDPETREFHASPTTTGGRAVCVNQKIRSDSYASFNILALFIIVVVGGLVVLVASVLPWITRHVQGQKRSIASLEWIANETIQLQRLAHEADRAGNWVSACDDYPRTRQGDSLAVLDVSNRKHPFLNVLPADNADERLH